VNVPVEITPNSVNTTCDLATLPASGGEASLLTRYEELTLIRRAQGGDRLAMDRLVRANVRLVSSVARRYRCRSFSTEDLVQEGILGLILAIERFDTARGCRLSTYALHWIRQAIARAAEQKDRLIHVPVQATAELRRLQKLREDFQRTYHREPREEELAEQSGIPEERVRKLLGTVQEPVSLEAMIGAEQDSPLLEMAEDPDAVNPEDDAVWEACQEDVRRLLQGLRPRERQVVQERFGLDGRSPQTLDEISRTMRISREGIRQIEARAIRKLRHALRESHWD
jgi:RNA polymerase sigma factor (sigma-70 family)